MHQPMLFNERERTIGERYDRWRNQHADVYQEFVRIALDLRRRGFERYSADGIGHVLRFHRAMRGDEGGFKLNNDLVSRMAREAMEEHEVLAGFFELRKLKAE